MLPGKNARSVKQDPLITEENRLKFSRYIWYFQMMPQLKRKNLPEFTNYIWSPHMDYWLPVLTSYFKGQVEFCQAGMVGENILARKQWRGRQGRQQRPGSVWKAEHCSKGLKGRGWGTEWSGDDERLEKAFRERHGPGWQGSSGNADMEKEGLRNARTASLPGHSLPLSGAQFSLFSSECLKKLSSKPSSSPFCTIQEHHCNFPS